MGFQYKFEKILTIKENEKDKVVGEYNEAVNKFEEKATKLYELLKQKEDIEAQQTIQIQTGIHIGQIQRLERFLLQLENSIAHWQQEVARARHFMEAKQKQLIEKNIEVKKYEKIKERALEDYIQIEKLKDNKLMDEISVQQFMNRGN